ncbi:alpha/beta hydrolase [Mycobacterium sherrisii]|uniref:Thioesterase n=1 Tax=Mycobacterium sherrisii TaxID=243061 RepID=A0A1E3TB15_9MYCO|nr:alpha/beta hydrolase [Mycobacterium sherrisii]MCV7031792.1 alpha/beta hydrolase [Mycobacterium sherrisii]MEC4762984.1 alpha/beta hydrolase [Mycobacterium sherrisii]ODR10868.1 thioesterase [Mycobacterium sherrisii]ORW86236.1 thioesterase [Mycobacterium sherrisii]
MTAQRISVRPRLVIVDGVPMSAIVAEAPDPTAVIVAIHGGGTTATYFDCPGYPAYSLLRAGAAAGFTVIALDRPGYGSSAAYPEAMTEGHQRVRLAYGAVDRILGEKPCGAGLFVVGHSGGCELTLRMAADERGAGLLGIELSGTGRRYQSAAREMLKAATRQRRPSGLRELLWHPEHLYPPEILRGVTVSPTAPAYEDQMVSDWSRHTFPTLAPAVRVPVHFSVAEHEKVWQTDDSAIQEIIAMFSAAPRCTVHRQLGAGHNISLGHTAAEYHARVLAFVTESVAARSQDAQQEEAG